MEVTQSTSYLQLLEYIKEKGIEEFQLFLGAIAKHSPEKWIDLTIRGQESLADLMELFPQVTEFYQTYPQNNLRYSLLDKKFATLVEYISENMGKLDTYIESFKVISSLEIDRVNFNPNSTAIEVEALVVEREGEVCARRTYFTDGNLSYQHTGSEGCMETYAGDISFWKGWYFRCRVCKR